MSKSLRPSKECSNCKHYFEAGYWFTGQYERLPNGKRKLLYKGFGRELALNAKH